jgi:hypothetical protein
MDQTIEKAYYGLMVAQRQLAIAIANSEILGNTLVAQSKEAGLFSKR